jgi:hypothetical protein
MKPILKLFKDEVDKKTDTGVNLIKRHYMLIWSYHNEPLCTISRTSSPRNKEIKYLKQK